jgi:hypothetical protein
MMRAVSSPVETQRELDQRRRAQLDANEVMHEQAAKLVRRRSIATVPGLAMGAGASMSRARGPRGSIGGEGCPSPLVTPFGEGWGAALPQREFEAQAMVCFPYNVASPASPHSRLARSYSVTNMENVGVPLCPTLPRSFHHRNSLPTSHSPFPLPSPTIPSSASPVMSRSRRGTLAPLTPIIPSSPLMSVEETEAIESFRAAVTNTAPVIMPGKLKRGMSY